MIIRINKIKIKKGKRKPSEIKISDAIVYYLENNEFKEEIMLDKDNYLISGYTTYIIKKEYQNKKWIKARREKNVKDI